MEAPAREYLMSLRTVNYDGTIVLKRYDAAEISVVIDDVNLLVMEHLDQDVDIDLVIRCHPGKECELFNLNFNVPDCSVEPTEHKKGEVAYRFKR